MKTLQRWDREGRLKPDRTATGRRLYTKAVRDGFLPSHAGASTAHASRPLSGVERRPEAGLDEPKARSGTVLCGSRCGQYRVRRGSGWRTQSTKFVALMDRIEARQISHLIIAHKDRPARFGFPWFERFCAERATELLVLNQEQL